MEALAASGPQETSMTSTLGISRALRTCACLCVLAGIALTSSAQAFDDTHSAYTELLQRYVSAGNVDYAELLAHRAELDDYIQDLADVNIREFQSWNGMMQLAFLINLYNAATLQLILDHYPVDSIKDIGGAGTKPWALKVVNLFGKTISLDTVEHGMIRKNYDDPRVHFALVCAARGCPGLRSDAYTGETLDRQLDEQVRTFLADPQKNRVDLKKHRLFLSPIFKWYKEDFQDQSKGPQRFLSQFLPRATGDELRRERFSVRYTDYDWTLNDTAHAR